MLNPSERSHSKWIIVFVAWIAMTLGCRSPEPIEPYPHRAPLSVIAELVIHLKADPYLTQPGRDLEGHNIFRVSLERLDQLEQLGTEEWDDVIAFARAQCLERLGQWNEATPQ